MTHSISSEFVCRSLLLLFGFLVDERARTHTHALTHHYFYVDNFYLTEKIIGTENSIDRQNATTTTTTPT